MDLGSITLLEICQMAHGNRVGYCLTRGEFLFVTPEAPRFFRAPSPGDLFGKNLRDFVAPCDLEKLQDYLRARSNSGALPSEVSSKISMMIRLVGSGQTLWVRTKTLPVSLRLLRCIDSVTVLASLKHHFADQSEFVVSDDDLTSIFNLGSRSEPPHPAPCFMGDNDVPLSITIPRHYEVPLELKSVSPSQCDAAMMSMSPASPTRMLDAFDESLSSLAFEADWAAESSTFPDLVSQ